jgi:hypothetical protein
VSKTVLHTTVEGHTSSTTQHTRPLHAYADIPNRNTAIRVFDGTVLMPAKPNVKSVGTSPIVAMHPNSPTVKWARFASSTRLVRSWRRLGGVKPMPGAVGEMEFMGFNNDIL